MITTNKSAVLFIVAISFSFLAYAQQPKRDDIEKYTKQLENVVDELCIEITFRYKNQDKIQCKRKIGQIFLDCSENIDVTRCVNSRLAKYKSVLTKK